MRNTVGIVGASDATDEEMEMARRVGELVAEAGCILVCGGLGGVMQAASEGAKSRGGLTVGILPSRCKSDANPFIDVAIPTGMGEARNALVAAASDALIAVGGGFGTLSEIAFALKRGIVVVSLGSWKLEEKSLVGVEYIEGRDADDAVKRVLDALRRRSEG